MHFWSQFLTDFHIWPTKSKLRTSSTRKKEFGDVLLPVRGLKMAKNVPKIADVGVFCQTWTENVINLFYQANKIHCESNSSHTNSSHSNTKQRPSTLIKAKSQPKDSRQQEHRFYHRVGRSNQHGSPELHKATIEELGEYIENS